MSDNRCKFFVVLECFKRGNFQFENLFKDFFYSGKEKKNLFGVAL